ncbi:expressed protein [Phakopsora pachyrhizi]|uniref:Expressed protein n=1 Tax=Phakopsora pachyrhizi TaxID=170000 RepID=A0AAV0AM62_PHAPC|nr:expressed protein [Phakopsora pachyrhizi]
MISVILLLILTIFKMRSRGEEESDGLRNRWNFHISQHHMELVEKDVVIESAEKFVWRRKFFKKRTGIEKGRNITPPIHPPQIVPVRGTASHKI